MTRNTRLFAPALFLSLSLFAACTGAPDADQAAVSDAQAVQADAQTGQSLKADTAATTIEWTGTKPTGRHHGTVHVQEGSLNVKDGNITGGRFVLNMKSIQALDQDADGNGKLTGHLSSPDFFDVEKYPTAVFEITSVTAGVDTTGGNTPLLQGATHTVTGNLTLKDQTKSISFPAQLSVSADQATADANFNIDRTHWGLRYRSGASFGDKVIHDDINLKLHLVAKK